MNVKIVYKDDKDRDFLNLIDLEVPFFIDYININTAKGKKEGWKIMNYYGTTTFPFVEVSLDEEKAIPFYSERGNAINQFINYLNGRTKTSNACTSSK